jgi:uncharacterized repeat protein (TIGR01451 family)
VAVKVRVPADAAANEPLTYRISVENTSRAAAHHVKLKNPLPSNVTFVSANPNPTQMSPALLWDLGTLAAGAKKEIELVVKPTGNGDVQCCARVQFEHGQCVRTRLGKVSLEARHTGPAKAIRYDITRYQVEVTNNGRTRIRGVTFTLNLPEDVKFQESKPSTKGDQKLTWDLGDLAPGQSRKIEYSVIPMKQGTFTCRGTAEAAGGINQPADVTMEVGEPALVLTKAGPAKRLVGRPATYLISVRNTGTAPLTNVQISDQLPSDILFVDASDGGKMEGEEVRWGIKRLEGGATRTVRLRVRAKRAGLFTNVTNASADRGISKQSKTETRFDPAIGLAVEVDKSADPLEIGQEATYTIRTLNAGKADETNVVLAIKIPEGLTIVDFKGATQGSQEPGKIIFKPVAKLTPMTDGTIFTVRLKADKAGQHKLEFEATSDKTGADRPVRVEETATANSAAKDP